MTAEVAADLRAQLTEAFLEHQHMWGDMASPQGYADALAPLVERIATERAAATLRRIGAKLLAADYEGPGGGAPSEQGWPHFDCEDILGEFLANNADALAEGQL